MKGHILLFVLSTMLMTCQKDYNKTTPPHKLIPTEANIVIKINAIKDFISTTETQRFVSSIYSKEIKGTSDILKTLNTSKPVYLSTSKKSEDFLILTANSEQLFIIDSLPNHSSETITEFEIDKIQIDSTTIYTKVLGNVFAASQNIDALKNLNQRNENKELSQLIETMDNASVSSVVFRADQRNYTNLLLNSIESKNYIVLDMESTENSLSYTGILNSNDSLNSAIDCFKNRIPQKIKAVNIAPSSIQSLKSITYDDYAAFNKNRNELFPSYSDSIPNFLNFTSEVAIIDDAIILYSLDSNIILESIEEKEITETFRDIDIYKYNRPDFFQTRLMPLLNYDNADYFCNFKNFILFSHSTEVLKSIVTDALNNKTLANTDAFIDLNDKLSDEASLFVYKNAESLKEIFGDVAKGYNANAVQLIYEDNYAHVNGVIQKFKKRRQTNSVSEAFLTKLDTKIISAPQTVKNHVTKAHDIVVQDVNNNLYLISSSGKVLWKKKLQDQILGKVEQIDMYKNGRLQLAFATSKRVYVLDRNGNDVSPFPLKFNDDITQPLSVFDYDNRKNYRLLVTQGKNLLMYDAKGKPVTGFKYKSNNAEVKTQPKHFRVSSKDYIVFGAGNTLKIINRQGADRINVNSKIRFSGNDIYLYKNTFTTTNSIGELIQVDTKGRLNRKSLNLTEQHKIEATSKTLVSLMDNKLTIKSRVIDLDFGDYTAPKIFYLNDKIYVTTTDLQSKKVYLFDSQVKAIPNFPVFGTSSAELQELDKNKGLELITQSDDKTIIIYKIN